MEGIVKSEVLVRSKDVLKGVVVGLGIEGKFLFWGKAED